MFFDAEHKSEYSAEHFGTLNYNYLHKLSILSAFLQLFVTEFILSLHITPILRKGERQRKKNLSIICFPSLLCFLPLHKALYSSRDANG